jgi:hypothetical protein
MQLLLTHFSYFCMSDYMYDVQGTCKVLSIYDIRLNDYYIFPLDITVFQSYLKAVISQYVTSIA